MLSIYPFTTLLPLLCIYSKEKTEKQFFDEYPPRKLSRLLLQKSPTFSKYYRCCGTLYKTMLTALKIIYNIDFTMFEKIIFFKNY